MKTKIFILAAGILFLNSSYGFAAGGESHHGSMGVMTNAEKTPEAPEEEKAVDVGNTICPVTGVKIGEMGPGATYELDGKIYHFCCAGCIEEFKSDPQKYIKIIEEQKKHDEQLGEEGKELSKDMTGQ